MNVLIVRLGALGDVVHAIPAVAALRRAHPVARIDWLVEARHRPIVDLVTAVDRAIVLERPTWDGWISVIQDMRRTAYDMAIDLQGLMKSAVLARASGAARVVGFSIWHLREKGARPFYTATSEPDTTHVIKKNLQLLRAIGVQDNDIAFPLAEVPSAALDRLRAQLPAGARFALINPGAAWPNKRWPPDRFGELCVFLSETSGLVPVVLWGPGEEALAQSVVAASSGAARAGPSTGVEDLVALARAAALMVSGDTGPLHIATALGTPVVGIFGPTDPARNGPWAADDVVVSTYERCACHYERRCSQRAWCLADVTATEVCAAVQQRLSKARARG
jgi:lipopolysaccharide heptosyltransferase I